MRALVATVLLVSSLAPGSAGDSTDGYLKSIGIDPLSPEVADVAGDVVPMAGGGVASLDELAKQKRPKADILRFISTRRFVHAYRADPKTRLPATVDYEAAYLTPKEKKLVQPAFRRAGDELYLRSLQQERRK